MSDFNKWIGTGNLTKDPEMRAVGDTQKCSFSIASNREYNGKKSTSYFDCEAWGKLGDVVNTYCSKGSRVLLEGAMIQENWQAADGSRRSTYILKVVWVCQFLSKPVEAEREPEAPADDSQIPF